MGQVAQVAFGPETTARSARRRGVLLVLLAGLLYSSAGLFTRALHYDSWTVLAWRSLFAALFLGGLVTVERRRIRLADFALGRTHLVLVPLTALGTVCYIFALEVTTVANVMIVYATMPFFTAAIAWLWSRERQTLRTLIASGVALLGVAVMIGGGGGSQGRILGVLLMVVMNISFALAIVLARRRPDVSMTPVNAFGLLLAALVSFVFAPGESVDAGSLLLMALFGILTIGMAMSLFMAGARLLPSAEVALIGISDAVLGPVLVWLAFGENPGLAAILGGAVVLAALVWHLWPEVSGLLRAAPARAG